MECVKRALTPSRARIADMGYPKSDTPRGILETGYSKKRTLVSGLSRVIVLDAPRGTAAQSSILRHVRPSRFSISSDSSGPHVPAA